MKNLFEYEETVAFDPKAQYVGRIGKIEEKDPVELETLPLEYTQFKYLFQSEATEKMRPRWTYNDPTIGSYNHYHLSPNAIPRGNQRWYGLVYLIQIAGCNMYTCSGNCIQERSAGYPMFNLITLLTLISLIVLQPRGYIKAR